MNEAAQSQRILPLALIAGLLMGLLVAAYMNIFNVPVMEWAIDLEGAAAEAAGETEDDPLPASFLTTLGAQRVGMTLGLAAIGIVFGAVFTALYYLMRRAAPGWNPWAWATVAGLLGFWSVSMFTQLKFLPNPPGVGSDDTLLARQGYQFLFMAVSLIAAGLVLYSAGLVNRTTAGRERWLRYAGIGLAYAVVALLLAYAVPSPSDAAPEWLPPSVNILFRTFTAIGHLLLWVGLGLVTAGWLHYRQRGIHAYPRAAVGAAD